MNTQGNLVSVVRTLITVLEASGEVYAFGGALALSAWSEPRATADVDIILWVDPHRFVDAVDLMIKAGAVLSKEAAVAQAETQGMFVGRVGQVRVDVFVPSIPFYEIAAKLRARTEILGIETWVHSAEVLAVFKMLFFRPKDLLDVERMLHVQGANLNRAFVRKHLVAMLSQDPRIDRWDEMCHRQPIIQ